MGTGAFVLKLVVLLGLELFSLCPDPAISINVPGSQNLLIRPSARAAVDNYASLVRSRLPALFSSETVAPGVGFEKLTSWGGTLETRYLTESDNQRVGSSTGG